MQQFLYKCSKFMDKLAPLLHMVYGGPARRTELMLCKIANVTTGLRNVFYVNGRVVIITRYHKGENQVGYQKVGHAQ